VVRNLGYSQVAPWTNIPRHYDPKPATLHFILDCGENSFEWTYYDPVETIVFTRHRALLFTPEVDHSTRNLSDQTRTYLWANIPLPLSEAYALIRNGGFWS
jgi:hypothetical protein